MDPASITSPRDETPQLQVQILDTSKQDQIKSILQEFFILDEKIAQTKKDLGIVKKAWKDKQVQIIDFMSQSGLSVIDTNSHGKVNLKTVSKKESMSQDFIKTKMVETLGKSAEEAEEILKQWLEARESNESKTIKITKK